MRTFEESWKVFEAKILNQLNSETYKRYPTGDTGSSDTESKQ